MLSQSTKTTRVKAALAADETKAAIPVVSLRRGVNGTGLSSCSEGLGAGQVALSNPGESLAAFAWTASALRYLLPEFFYSSSCAPLRVCCSVIKSSALRPFHQLL